MQEFFYMSTDVERFYAVLDTENENISGGKGTLVVFNSNDVPIRNWDTSFVSALLYDWAMSHNAQPVVLCVSLEQAKGPRPEPIIIEEVAPETDGEPQGEPGSEPKTDEGDGKPKEEVSADQNGEAILNGTSGEPSETDKPADKPADEPAT